MSDKSHIDFSHKAKLVVTLSKFLKLSKKLEHYKLKVLKFKNLEHYKHRGTLEQVLGNWEESDSELEAGAGGGVSQVPECRAGMLP